MATILAFRAARAADAPLKTGSQPCENPSKSAELIFFPGVRYERAASEAETSPRRARRSKSRELIDMMD